MRQPEDLTEKEIENFANGQAEREAFVKSSIVFGMVLLVGFFTLLFVPRVVYVPSYYTFDLSWGLIYFFIVFIIASILGMLTRWLVKGRAYEKYYALYKEQQE